MMRRRGCSAELKRRALKKTTLLVVSMSHFVCDYVPSNVILADRPRFSDVEGYSLSNKGYTLFYDEEDGSCVVAYHVPYEYCSSPYPPLDDVVDEHVEYMELMAQREKEPLTLEALPECRDVSSSYSMEFSYILQDETNATSERSRANAEQRMCCSAERRDHYSPSLPMESLYSCSESSDELQRNYWATKANAVVPLREKVLCTNEQKSGIAIDECLLEKAASFEQKQCIEHPFELDPEYDSGVYSLNSEYMLDLQKQEEALHKAVTGTNDANDGGSKEDGGHDTLRLQSQMLSPCITSSEVSELKEQSLRIIEQLHRELTNDIVKIQQLQELNSQRLRLQLDNTIQQTRNEYDELHARIKINTDYYKKKLSILFQ